MSESVQFKTGAVSAVDPGKAAVRVKFDDIGLESYWLPVIYPKTQDDKFYWLPDVGEQVRCVMDARLEDGSVIGAIYSDADVAPVASADKFRLQFKDGGHIEYDRGNGKLDIKSSGDLAAVVGGDLSAIVVGAASIEAGGEATLKASRVIIDAPETETTGNLRCAGQLSYAGGLVAQGGGAGAAARIGALDVESIKSATPIDDDHTHSETGSETSGPH